MRRNPSKKLRSTGNNPSIIDKELTLSGFDYQKAFEYACDAILILDAKSGQIIKTNTKVTELLGYTPDKLIGKTLWEINPLKNIIENKDKLKIVQEKEHIHYDDLPLTKKDGSKILVELTSCTYEVNSIKQIQYNIRDISMRKQTEEKENNRYSNIKLLSKTAMQFVDFPKKSDIFDFVGEQIRELVGKESYIVVNTVDSNTGISKINSVLGFGKLAKIITTKLGRHPVGMEFDVEDRNIHYQDGKLHVYQDGLYGILLKTIPESICKSIEKLTNVNKIYVIDLAKQEQFFGSVVIFLKKEIKELQNKQVIETFIKQASIAILKNQAEEQLLSNEKKLNQIIDTSPIGICTVDPLGNFITTNYAYELMLGYSKKELNGLSFFDITHPDNRPKNKKLFQDMFALKTTSFAIEKKYVRKDGVTIDVSVQATVLLDPEGIAQFGTAYVENITKRKLTEESLQQMALFPELNPAPIMRFAEDGTIISSNPAANTVIGNAATMGNRIKTALPCFNDIDFSKCISNDSMIKREAHINDRIYQFTMQGISKFNIGHIYGADITERKQAAETLKENELLLKQTQEISKVGGWSYNISTDQFKFTDETFNIYGIPIGDIPSLEDLISFYHPNDRKIISEALSKAINAGKAYDLKVRFINAQGENLFVKIICSPVIENRKAVKLVGAIVNITKQKQDEEMLIESMEQLDLALEGANAGLWSWNIKTGDDLLDERWCAILGYKKDEIKQQVSSWTQLMHPDDKDRIMDVVNKHIEDEKNEYKHEYRMKCKNGKWKWIFAIGKVVKRDENGEPVQMTGIIIDISEQKQTQKKLQISETKYKNQAIFLNAIILKSPFAMWVSDANGILIRANQALRNILNVADEMIIGKYNVLYDEKLETQGLKPVIEAVFYDLKSARFTTFWEGSNVGEMDLTIANKLWIDVSMYPITDETGKLVNVVCQYVDITERKHAEMEVQKSNEELEQRVRLRTSQIEAINKELEAFSYSVSHDLRAPLRAISGFSQILVEDYSDKLGMEGQRQLKVIQDSTSKMGQLIADLLKFSRLGQTEIEPSSVDMEALVREVFEKLQDGEPLLSIQLLVKTLPITSGDRGLLNIVFTNLLSNAIKFSRSKKNITIEITGSSEGNENIYSVKDNGVGFDMAYVDKMFQVFQRLHSSKDFEGTGIGLALVQRIINRLGGRVWAEGEVNKGATIFFTIPQRMEMAK